MKSLQFTEEINKKPFRRKSFKNGEGISTEITNERFGDIKEKVKKIFFKQYECGMNIRLGYTIKKFK